MKWFDKFFAKRLRNIFNIIDTFLFFFAYGSAIFFEIRILILVSNAVTIVFASFLNLTLIVLYVIQMFINTVITKKVDMF